MNRLVFFVLCSIIGGSLGYNVRREAPYNEGPNHYNLDYMNYQSEPSQRLFWGNQGSNQVGGTGLWGTLTNKFPFLGPMFGKMELSNQYGAPNQYPSQALAAQYGVPNQYPTQPQYISPDRYQAQLYQAQQFNQQPPLRQGFVPSGRDVALTDDAVVVTPPFVPAVGAPAPPSVPQLPQIPISAPNPPVQPPQNQFTGYSYNKPQYRLELPHK
ncbi:uncharacterized protein LOC115455548 [Manduca sexta]|uniref:uncharacterized protein LOC115455548 n=1 Tax=Manduca sexta TaxID=7130 RepID=UPI00188EC40D|nr:uncharacterized protein LOC115455548 [Manduca sexta]